MSKSEQTSRFIKTFLGVLKLIAKGLIRMLALVASGNQLVADGGTTTSTGRGSSSPIRIEIQGANGRWSFAGSAIDSGAAISEAMERALHQRRDASKARAVDTRSGIVVDFTAR